MRWKAGILALAGALVAVAAMTPATAGRSTERRSAPRVRGFSPAAIHAGDEFLVDAEFGSGREPRIRVGGRRLDGDSVRVERGERADGSRRIWARVPKRFPAGRHEIRVETRAGSAVAAKPIEVASCNAAPPGPADCDDIPASGFAIVVTGPKGYRKSLSSADPPTLTLAAGHTMIRLFDGGMAYGDQFSIDLPLHPVELHLGDAPDAEQSFYDMVRTVNYRKDPGPGLTVGRASDTSVGICVDTELTGMVHDPDGGPVKTETVHVKGHIVIPRAVPPAADCGVAPAAGVSLDVTGPAGYHASIVVPDSVVPEPPRFDDRFTAQAQIPGADELLVFAFSRDPANWHTGLVPVARIDYSLQPSADQTFRIYGIFVPTGVRVVSETADTVTICIDVTLPIQSPETGATPTEVHVKGYVVMTRVTQ